jgi:transcriptional regulator with XRE-family HTH domain
VVALDRQHELADFLRRLRGRSSREAVGLPVVADSRRRAPGLRREELAALAGISVDWYIRLEQGRAERPSPSVLDSLARVLHLTDDERSHLYALAGAERPPLDRSVAQRAGSPQEQAATEPADPSLVRVLRSLPAEVPGYVLGRRWDVLAWNRGACDLLIDFAAVPAARRNLVWLIFRDEHMRGRYAEWEQVAHATLANFRASVARHLEEPDVQAMVAGLAGSDSRFAAWWGEHAVAEKSTGVKLFHGPDGASFAMRFESVLSPTAADQRLIVYTPCLP